MFICLYHMPRHRVWLKLGSELNIMPLAGFFEKREKGKGKVFIAMSIAASRTCIRLLQLLYLHQHLLGGSLITQVYYNYRIDKPILLHNSLSSTHTYKIFRLQ